MNINKSPHRSLMSFLYSTNFDVNAVIRQSHEVLKQVMNDFLLYENKTYNCLLRQTEGYLINQ